MFVLPYSMEREMLREELGLGRRMETLSTETTTEKEPDLILGYLDPEKLVFHKGTPGRSRRMSGPDFLVQRESIDLVRLVSSSVLRASSMGSMCVDQATGQSSSSDSLRLSGLFKLLKGLDREHRTVAGVHHWFFSLTPKQQANLKSFIDSLAEKESDVTTVLPDSLTLQDLDGETSSTPTTARSKS
jgi:hypothetical protein